MSVSSISAAPLTAMADFGTANAYAAAGAAAVSVDVSASVAVTPDDPNVTAGAATAVGPVQKATAPGTALTVDVFA
jgi:hypothetical protein